MALLVKKAGDFIPITSSIILLYGDPGTRKTSFFFTAKRPILFDFDYGIRRVDEKHRKDWVHIEVWEDLLAVTKEDLADFDTLGFDAVGRMVDVLCEYVMRQYPNYRQPDGSISIKGWGPVKTLFRQLLQRFQSWGKDLVYVAHSNEEKSGNKSTNRPDIAGASRKAIINDADLVGFVQIINNAPTVCWTPTAEYFGKNSCNLPATQSIAKVTLADLIAQFKESVNANSEEYAIYKKQVDSWLVSIDETDTPDKFKTLVTLFTKMEPEIWKLTAANEIWLEIVEKGDKLGWVLVEGKWTRKPANSNVEATTEPPANA